MIDFIKIRITHKPTIINLLQSGKLIEHSKEEKPSRYTGNIIQIERFTYDHFLFKKVNTDLNGNNYNLEFTGSLHHYFNESKNNANQFTADDCIKALRELATELNLNLKDCSVLNIEFGINIEQPYDIKTIIDSFIYHGRNPFRIVNDLPFCKHSSKHDKKGQSNQYKIIKVYAKGLHMPEYCNANTLRYEIRSNRTEYIKKRVKIYTLNDLLNKATYTRLYRELIKEFSNITMIDSINKYPKEFHKFFNTLFWAKTFQQHRHSFQRNRKKYLGILKLNQDNIYDTISNLIRKNAGTILRSHRSIPKNKKVTNLSVSINKEFKSNKLNIDNIKRCQVTGVDISMQRCDSSILSVYGLWYLSKENPTLFEKVKRVYGIRTSIDLETQILFIAKRIKNIKRSRYFIPNGKRFKGFFPELVSTFY